MKKFYSVLGTLLLLLYVPVASMAADDDLFSQVRTPEQPVAQSTMQAFQGQALQQVYTDLQLKQDVVLSPQAKTRKTAARKAVTQLSELAGNYVMTFKSLTSDIADGGLAVSIAPVEGQDSVTITNFWSSGLVVKAHIDLATGKVSIPNQKLGTHSTYGDYDLAFCTSTGKPDRAKAIEGTLNADGTLSLDSWWGAFVISGSKKDAFFGAYYKTLFEAGNATMSQTVRISSTGTFVNSTYPVIVEQSVSNVLTVKNFGNYGCTVEIVTKGDSTATIASQAARLDMSNGTWYTYGVTWKEDYSGIAKSTGTITCAKATDARTLSWGGWTMACSNYYLGVMTEASIATTADITYPQITTTEWQGEGTAENPYKISTLADLVLLADSVNNDTHLDYTYNKLQYARVFLGKHFVLTNDIDMGSLRVSPIGADFQHRFAGTFDGQGHTLKDLRVSTGSNGYAALFGLVDTVGVIKNLTLDNPSVATNYYYAGGVAALSMGTIENCHVKGGSVVNNVATGSAGIAAIAYTVKDCTVKGTSITATGGYGGGVAGQVNILISNSSAEDVDIKAGGVSDTYPSGGVVGSLYGGKAVNCHYTGTLDGRYHTNLVLGGVAGTCYKGAIDQCFASGVVLGYSSKAVVGGVVGMLYGPLTNSYSNCVVTSISSKYAGGLVGEALNYTDSLGNNAESAIRNCYSASVVGAETYQYDKDNERRELIGTIPEGSNPTVENAYYDTQMVDFKSTAYRSNSTELTAAAGPKGFDASVWTFAEGYYPRLSASAETEAAKFSASLPLMNVENSLDKVAKNVALRTLGATEAYYAIDGTKSQKGLYSSISGDSIMIGNDYGVDTLYISSKGIGARYYFLSIAPIPYEGGGSETNPYLLKTKQDLLALGVATTQKKQLFPDTWFKVANDINMERDTTFLGICTDADDAYNKFAGHIDGDGHTLHNVKVRGAVKWKVTPEAAGNASGYGEPNNTTDADGCKGWKGLIGRLAAEGSLKNLTMAADCDFDPLWASCSPFVGANYGLIENCRNYADVTAISCWVGGFAGQNEKEGIIRNCYNAGAVTTGYMCAGGIAGTNYGLIENCENAGDVTAKRLTSTFPKGSTWQFKSVGGIGGSSNGGRFANCVNSGTVTADTQVGGISGSLPSSTSNFKNSMVNCVNYGQVFALDDNIKVGVMSGTGETTGEVKGNYYDGQITVYGAAGNSPLEGMTAATTATLTSGKALEGYDANLWDFAEGKYPVLKQFADEALAKTTRGIILSVSEGETVGDLHHDATLGTNDGCTWALKQGTTFTIEQGTLKSPVSVDEVVTDTLVATVGGVQKPIVLKSLPVNPLAGEGTEASPFLINTSSDWNALAKYIASCGDALTGQHVAITADLDFTGSDIVPLSYDFVTNFNGDLDGRNHTLKGIARNVGTTAGEGGAFTTIGADAYVHNLTVEGSIAAKAKNIGGVVGTLSGKLDNVVSKVSVSNTQTYTAGVAGVARKGARLTNVTNQGAITSSSASTAGLVGYSEDSVYYEGCSNVGTVTYTGTTTSAYLAGLIGTCNPDTIIECYNEGKVVITDKSNKAAGVAGLIGNATASKDSRPYYIKYCYNTADITSACNSAGLVALVSTSGYTTMVMDGCYNTGNVTSTYPKTKSGNYTAGLSLFYGPGSTFTNCWNSGTVRSEGPACVGGLFAYFKGTFTDSTRTVISNCRNTGALYSANSNAGGISSALTNYVTIDSCYNTGAISGGYGLGGIVSTMNGNYAKISNSWNAGAITTTANRCGGIYATGSFGLSEVVNCFNVGDIVSTAETAKDNYGLGGIAGYGGGHFKGVYSLGHISGLGRVGGLVGYSIKATETANGISGTCIADAYFAGTLTAPADTCGMIVGVHMDDNGRQWNATNVASNIYYLAGSKVECVDTLGQSIGSEALTQLNLGGEWVSDEPYCYPTLAGVADNDYARIHSIAVVPAEGDTVTLITKDFHVGSPAGVTWTTSTPALTISGNDATFAEDFTGEATLTATSGEVSKTFTIHCQATASAIANLRAGKAVVAERFYTTGGVEVAAPKAGATKGVYVVVRTYSDNTQETVRELR